MKSFFVTPTSSIILSLLLLFISGIASAADSNRDFLIDADTLLEKMESDNKPVILEVRYHPHRYFTVGHIPGAIQVQRFKDLGANLANPVMRFPAANKFQQTLRSWGINNNSEIVIYDDSSTALSARLYVMLIMYGFDASKVKVLNGGTREWMGMNEMVKEATPMPKPGNVTLKDPNSDMLIEWPVIYRDVLSLRKPDVVLIDARPKGMYTGEVVRHAVQGGHIPGAINIVSLDGTDAMAWKSAEDLADMYKDISKDKTIYLYCHDGFRMSLAWMQLKSLGYQHVKLLNGGWTIWDKAMTLPIVKGDKPYDEEYAL